MQLMWTVLRVKLDCNCSQPLKSSDESACYQDIQQHVCDGVRRFEMSHSALSTIHEPKKSQGFSKNPYGFSRNPYGFSKIRTEFSKIRTDIWKFRTDFWNFRTDFWKIRTDFWIFRTDILKIRTQ